MRHTDLVLNPGHLAQSWIRYPLSHHFSLELHVSNLPNEAFTLFRPYGSGSAALLTLQLYVSDRGEDYRRIW